MSSRVDVSLGDIFFESYTVDPNFGHSIYLFDSTQLPSANEVESKEVYDMLIDELMDHLILKLPTTPYSLVVFSSGFSKNNISWIYGVKMYSKIPKESREFLQRIYIVHESFFVRTVHQVLTNALNFKFISNKERPDLLTHIANLTELSQHVDITLLRISLNVYLHDYQINESIEIPERYLERKSSLAKRQYRQLIFDKIFKRLRIEAPRHELVFQRPGSYQRVNILLGVIERNNHIDLSQWDVYSLASVFLQFLKNKSKPIFSIDLIPLPISDSPEYTYDTFVKMMMSNNYYDLVFFTFQLFLSLLDNSEITKHDYRTLSKCLTPTLCQEKVSIKNANRLAIGYRFVRNIFVHFDYIIETVEKNEALSIIRQSPMEKKNEDRPPLPKARKVNSSQKNGIIDYKNDLSMRNVSPPPLPKRDTDGKSGVLSESIIMPSLTYEGKRNISKGSNVSTLVDAAPICSQANDSTFTLVSDTQDEFSQLEFHAPPLFNDPITSKVPSSPGGLLILEEDVSKLILDNNEKIQTFDKELKRKKNAESTNVAKLSQTGYSDIKVGNKVSRLAALYEERLMGLQVIEDMRLNQAV